MEYKSKNKRMSETPNVNDNFKKRVFNFPMTIEDDYKNQFIIEENPKTKNRTIYLKLQSEKRKRKLGNINMKERWMVVLRTKARHLHRKSDSYGFNYDIINKTKSFDSVLLREDKGTYLIPNSVILEKGEFLFFKTQGFEKQIFLSRQIIKQYERGHIF
jgi:hypothetical protein